MLVVVNIGNGIQAVFQAGNDVASEVNAGDEIRTEVQVGDEDGPGRQQSAGQGPGRKRVMTRVLGSPTMYGSWSMLQHNCRACMMWLLWSWSEPGKG